MAGAYRGVLKVAGSEFRGWLMDTARPERRVRFNLVIDGQVRGTFAANKWRRFLLGRGQPGEDTHGFAIAIRKPWVSGELQSVRIEDGEDPALKFSLMTRLGPSAHALFDDHVVSGQLLIGQDEPRVRERARKARIVEDEPDRDARPAAVNKALLRQIGMLSDTELANLMLAVDRDIVVERLSKHEKSGDWESAFVYRRAFTSAAAEQRLIAFGRGAMKAHNHGLAVRVTAAAAALHPQSFEANYLAGSARSLHGDFDEAMRYLRAADRFEEGGKRARREMVIVLAKQMRGEMTPERRLELRNERLSLLRGLSASEDPQVRVRYRVPHAEALFGAGRYDEAIAAVEAVLSDAPNDTRALMIKARSLVARNQIEEAVAVYEAILDMDQTHRGARMNLRLLAALTEEETVQAAQTGSSVAQLHVLTSSRESGSGAQTTALTSQLANVPHSWICTTAGYFDETIAPEILALLDANTARRTGYAEIGLTDGRRLEFWRRDALSGLAESGLLTSLDDSVALARWRPFYGPRERIETASRTTRPKRGVAVLISRNGADLYGGGEHFLDNAAEHHARQGFEPVIVGTRGDLGGEERIVAGRRSVFVGDRTADLRKFLLENEVSLVHAISGVGFSVADALNYTNIPFLYGVHFWNELLGDPDQTGYFDEVTGESRFRREFPLILSRATAIYANSHFTQRIIEDGFGVRCPVVFAVPREVA